MFNRTANLLKIFFLALLPGIHAFADDDVNPDQVLAKVNGIEITLRHVIAMRIGLPPEYNQYDPDILFNGIIDELVRQTLLMQSIIDETTPGIRAMIDNETRAILSQEASNKAMFFNPSSETILQLYNIRYPENQARHEYHASHILVDDLEKAEEVKTLLDGGAGFAEMAMDHSTGPSGPGGGDLGWFREGTMVPAFFEAVAELQPGKVSNPVETQFGWHLIKLHESRELPRPALEVVINELTNELRLKELERQIAKYRESSQVEIGDTSNIDPKIISNVKYLRQ
ncbi:MAG: peptidylprolyl isomerase [Roseovarius sp.]|nr:peptidylprolyl isomerase [Roseovarius sp.]